MPASASTASTICPHQDNNIIPYKLEKKPFTSPIITQTHPSASSTLNSLRDSSSSFNMKEHCLPTQDSANRSLSTDISIPPVHENITSDFSKLDTLAAAAGSILVSLANLGQSNSASSHANMKNETIASNETSSRKDILQCPDNLADLAAAAISSLSDLATTGADVHIPKQMEPRSEYKKAGFMSISALLDESPNQSTENPKDFQSNSSSLSVREIVDQNIRERTNQSGKRFMVEPEFPSKKLCSSRADLSVSNRNIYSNDEYLNASTIDNNIPLPPMDGLYLERNSYNGPPQSSDISATKSTSIHQCKPTAHGLNSKQSIDPTPTGYCNIQPSYQSLRVEGSNTFSKKFQSMQDPKVKRNATHAYIAYMIYTDRLQSMGLETKELTSVHRSVDSSLPANHYGHTTHVHSHSHPFPYPHNHDHSTKHSHISHPHTHPIHNHTPQHNHIAHQHYPHQHQRPYVHQHPHSHQHQHPYHHHHSHDQHGQPLPNAVQLSYTSNFHVESRYTQSPVAYRSNLGRQESQESSTRQYYSLNEHPASGLPPIHSLSSHSTSTTTTIPGYSSESGHGPSHRRNSSSSNAYVSGTYSTTSLAPQSTYSSNIRSSQSLGNYGFQPSQTSPGGSSGNRHHETNRISSKPDRF